MHLNAFNLIDKKFLRKENFIYYYYYYYFWPVQNKFISSCIAAIKHRLIERNFWSNMDGKYQTMER
jgi:hypothetical protein